MFVVVYSLVFQTVVFLSGNEIKRVHYNYNTRQGVGQEPKYSILLQISPDNKHTLAIIGHSELLRAPDILQALQATPLGKHNVHFKAITDLDGIMFELGHDKGRDRQTSMRRSVAPVNASTTISRTVGSGKCSGCDAPGASCWFMKPI